VKPVLQALVLAEHIYTDLSGKKVICGTFNGLNISKAPIAKEIVEPDGTKKVSLIGGMNIGSPYLYINLTDVFDGTEIVIQFMNLNDNLVVFQSKLMVQANQRAPTVEIVAPLPALGLFITGPGQYSFDVLCEDEIIGSHRLTVSEIEQPPVGDQT
jgi:hypothetical protein